MNILSCRSGGVRGCISLLLLMELEKKTGKAIYELFDNLGGSSIGALIITGLLLSEDGKVARYTAHQLYEVFLVKMGHCFSWTYLSYLKSGFGLFGSIYTNDGLSGVVYECCEDYKVKDLLRPIVLPTYDKITNKNYYFDNKKDAEVMLKDVVISCGSAPTFFPAHEVKIDERTYHFIDSGIVTTSCTKLVVLDTLSKYPVKKEDVLLVVIGTGTFSFPNVTSDGLTSWAPNIINTMFNASYENELHEVSMMLDRQNYFIMDVPLDIKYYLLDNYSKEVVDYYIGETKQWLLENDANIQVFCDKLVKNY